MGIEDKNRFIISQVIGKKLFINEIVALTELKSFEKNLSVLF